MKFKKIIDLCKKSNTLFLYDNEKNDITEQWISDGYSIYPICNMSLIDLDSIFQMFDIPDKKRETMLSNHFTSLPEAFDFSDAIAFEVPVERMNITLSHQGKQIIPVKLSTGIGFIDKRYLAPFDDEDTGMFELYERITALGNKYFAIKNGMILRGIVLPVNVINENFLNELTLLTKLCHAEYENNAEERKEQNSDE